MGSEGRSTADRVKRRDKRRLRGEKMGGSGGGFDELTCMVSQRPNLNKPLLL